MSGNADLWRRREQAVARGVASVHRNFVARASNTEIHDVEDRRLIDFASGIAVCNTGHTHPRIVAAVKAQLDRFSHACFQVTPYECYVRLAERLNALAPGTGPHKTLLVTTGAEAVENAVKIARAHTRRSGVVAFSGGYHGRTLMTLALTGKVLPYKARFGPMPPEIHHARFPFEYHGVGEAAAWESLMEVFRVDIEASATAAIVIEPVLGEGGFYVTPFGFLRQLRDFCDQNGIVLIIDEIQSGFARTGRMFAVEHSGVEPDLMAVAKAMAGGFPISGVVGKADIMDAPEAGGLGGTYGGSPLGCIAGLEVLDIIEEEDLAGRAVAIGSVIKDRLLAAKQSGLDMIGDVRGLGAMVAVELVKGGDPAHPDPDLARTLVAEAMRRGLSLLPCGVRGNVIRFLPPLTCPDAIVAEAMDILVGAMVSQQETTRAA